MTSVYVVLDGGTVVMVFATRAAAQDYIEGRGPHWRVERVPFTGG